MDVEVLGGGDQQRYARVMFYLKKLAPSAVDAEISLLCQGEFDEEGIRLLGLGVEFLLGELRCV
ncbi:unnamed protein product [Choristocarpus tenellus]